MRDKWHELQVLQKRNPIIKPKAIIEQEKKKKRKT